jgi:hypothetical protein
VAGKIIFPTGGKEDNGRYRGAVATSPAGAILREDEAKFMMADRFRATEKESLLAGPPRGVETGAVRKYALFLTRPSDVSEADFAAVVADWSSRLFAGNALTRITMDIVRPLPGGVFPADAIVSLWPNDRFDESGFLATSAAIGNAGILTLESHETRPEVLTAAH